MQTNNSKVNINTKNKTKERKAIYMEERIKENLFLIDIKQKGNVIRFCFGSDPEYWGDDWDDRPFEDNAGQVYPQYIKRCIDIAYDFDDVVIQPYYKHVSKADMKAQKIPCLVVLSAAAYKKHYEEWQMLDFDEALQCQGAQPIYFGESIEKFLDKIK